ncbi:MAG: glycine/sarcosine/betaine reductase complex component C subunit beta, partial [Spirochaetota bacterium]
HTILENLACKATGVYALRRLLADNRIDPKGIDYIIETSEEACGDSNQRGGGNFAKAIGELCGLANATGCDVRSFCAGPAHGLVHASAMVSAGTARRVVVVAGGTTAKLAMNAKRHIEKGFPVLEDCMASFAFIVDGDAGEGLLVRDKIVGMHKIGSGSSPQAVIQDLVAEPLARAGLRFSDIDAYAPELQNSEITEAGGAGNVTLANLKMIAAMAVMKGELAKADMDAFVAAHGLPGWAPTQGHIPSGVPAIGWFLKWAREGTFTRGLLMGKGSLFLGRMTGLFDGVSVLLEAWKRGDETAGTGAAVPAKRAIGLTIPGSEGGREELLRGAAEAARADGTLETVLFGDTGDSLDSAAFARREMEEAFATGTICAAVTFHYSFPIGVATVGHMKAPGNGRDLFIASTTGASATNRVDALVLNAISGMAVAKAFGISRPSLGLLNLEAAPRAFAILRELRSGGFDIDLGASVRDQGVSAGEVATLLRGNDILAGTVDILVCDSLTGNAIVKLLASFTTAGRIEVAGSGYGPGVGPGAPAIGIISRATAAPVVANAMALMARMDRGGLGRIYAELRAAAEKAGLSRLLSDARKRSGGEGVENRPAVQGGDSKPTKKVVQHEIAGIDVAELDEAIAGLQAEGIYCEAGMGCTGPVAMVADEDSGRAKGYLMEKKFIGGNE